MAYVYLIASVFFIASSSIFGGFYSRKHEKTEGSSRLYNFLQLTVAFLVWTVIYLFDFSFDWRVLAYALLFGGCYTICMIGMINALKTGSVALTSLFLQLSLIGVTLWGFVFWDVSVTLFAVLGLLLVVVALCLCLYTGKREKTTFNGKWFFYVALMFLGNAGCSIVQRTQQTAFDGRHSGMLMAFATAISALTCLIIFLRGDKTDLKRVYKQSWWLPVLAGGCNVALNMFVMLLATSPLSPGVVYPVISVGGLTVSMIFSIVAFKEKLKWQQWVGVAIGILAVGILSV